MEPRRLPPNLLRRRALRTAPEDAPPNRRTSASRKHDRSSRKSWLNGSILLLLERPAFDGELPRESYPIGR